MFKLDFRDTDVLAIRVSFRFQDLCIHDPLHFFKVRYTVVCFGSIQHHGWSPSTTGTSIWEEVILINVQVVLLLQEFLVGIIEHIPVLLNYLDLLPIFEVPHRFEY